MVALVFVVFALLQKPAMAAPAQDNGAPFVPNHIITVEEHYVFPSLPSTYPKPDIDASLHDVGETRLSNMDAGRVTVQVLSSLSGLASTNSDGCMKANDDLAAIVKNNTKRYGGFACLPMATPVQAAAELERAVRTLGLSGAMIDNHLPDGTYYDNETYWPVFAKAVELDVPLYIHPAPPSTVDSKLHYQGNYAPSAAAALGAATFGWHADTGLHIIRLYAAGLFNKLPHPQNHDRPRRRDPPHHAQPHRRRGPPSPHRPQHQRGLETEYLGHDGWVFFI